MGASQKSPTKLCNTSNNRNQSINEGMFQHFPMKMSITKFKLKLRRKNNVND